MLLSGILNKIIICVQLKHLCLNLLANEAQTLSLTNSFLV